MKYENKHLIVAFVVAVILTLICVWVISLGIPEVSGVVIEKPVCPVCPPQVITAKSIKANVVDYSGQRFETMTKIKLPESVSEIQIGEDVFKKEKYNPDNFILEEEIFKRGK